MNHHIALERDHLISKKDRKLVEGAITIAIVTIASVTIMPAAVASSCSPQIFLLPPSVSGLSVSVNGGTSPCGSGTSITSISWSWGDGSVNTAWFPAGHVYCGTGTYTITATSHQSDGLTASMSTSATVTGPACPPTLYLQEPLVIGNTVIIQGIADACLQGTTISSLSLTWGDGTSSASLFPSQHVYSVQGTYTITATAHRSDGQVAVASTLATIPTLWPSWQAVGPRSIGSDPCLGRLPGAGKLQAFAMDPLNSTIMYVGGGIGPGNSGPGSEGGLFKSVNGGLSWFPINNGLGDPVVSAVWVDQLNSSIVLASTFLSGIFRSVDSGQHWSPAYSFPTSAFSQTGSTIYAASSDGVVQSTNGGSTWSVVHATSSPVRALSLGGGAIYAGLDDGTVIARLSPSGSWQTLLSDPGHTVWSVAVNASNVQTAFAVEWLNYQSPDLYVTRNGGSTWSTVSLNGAVQYVAINATQSNQVYAGVDGSLFVSNDGGRNFSALPLQVDIRLIQIIPHGPLIIGSDQGIYASYNQGASWISLNGNLASSLLTGLAVDHGTILTAVQDYSPILSYDNGTTWQVLSGTSPPVGEDGTVAFNPGNSSYAYAYTSSGLQYSTNGGRTFQSSPQIGGSLFTFSGTNNLIGVDPNTPARVYAVTTGSVYFSTNWGVTFAAEPWAFSQPSLVVVNPSNSQTIFVGDNTGLHYTTNGGSTWSTSTMSGSSGYPVTLSFDPLNNSIVFAGLSYAAENGGGIWRSTDGGRTFTADNTGITNQPMVDTGTAIWDLSFQPSSQVLAVATTHGLYISADLGTTWKSIAGNIVPYWFTDIAWSQGYLYASTYGEGVVRLPFPISSATANRDFAFDWSDYDNSGTIDILDLVSDASCFGSTPASPNWAKCGYWDLSLTGTVDITSLVRVASQLGSTRQTPYPGQGQTGGRMDHLWNLMCPLLSQPNQAYCKTLPP